MNRRSFLQSSAAAALAQSLPWSPAFAAASDQNAGWQAYEIITRVEVKDSFGVARAWVPLGLEADTDWQRTLGNGWSGNAREMRVMRDPKYGISMLYAEWPEREADPVVQVTTSVMTRERKDELSD